MTKTTETPSNLIKVGLILILFLGESVSLPQSKSGQSGGGGSGVSGNMSKRRVVNNNNLVNNFHSRDSRPVSSLSLFDSLTVNKWITACLKFFEFHRCTQANVGGDDDCFKLSVLRRSQIAVYIGHNNHSVSTSPKSGSGAGGKVYAILPDSSTPKASGPHDVIIAVDPYPGRSFGHLVGLFYVDFDVDEKNCKEDFQIYMTDGTCTTVGRKPRCPNLVERFTTGLQPKRCHIDFLPTVYPSERVIIPSSLAKTDSGQDLLECVSLPGFSPCPKLRPLEDTTKVLCDARESNSKRCDTSHTGVGTRCKLFQTCDRAVLIGGGWNRHHSNLQSLQNMAMMENALKSTGFHPENIKTFFANGRAFPQTNKGRSAGGRSRRTHRSFSGGGFFSSAMKTGLRGHIRTMCETRHCADTLFIYLNNPTTFEGDMLLWDVDYNGIADELEMYTLKEFLWDISGCEAKRVFLLVDQSNSDILLSSLKSSVDHQNVVILTAGLPNELPLNGELTKTFVNNSHPIRCLRHVQKMTLEETKGSNPVFYDTTQGLSSQVSLVGAPCDLNPPVNNRELKSLYQGCQNVPTSIWFSFDFEDMGDLGVGGNQETEGLSNSSVGGSRESEEVVQNLSESDDNRRANSNSKSPPP